jgi:hypothetical protein
MTHWGKLGNDTSQEVSIAMTTELTMLALSVVLGLVQIVLSAQSKNFVTGYR